MQILHHKQYKFCRLYIIYFVTDHAAISTFIIVGFALTTGWANEQYWVLFATLFYQRITNYFRDSDNRLFAKLFSKKVTLTFELLGKCFIISAVGLRLFTVGLQQSIKPRVISKEIFYIESPKFSGIEVNIE